MTRILHILLMSCFILLCSSIPVFPQELDCTIKVNYESVGTSNKDLLTDFANDLRDYMNNYRWGADDVEERVRCTFDIFIQNVVGEDRYTAQVFIGSVRPVYGTEKNTAVVRLFDDQWEFTYQKYRPINHSVYSFADLASFLDFYAYIILGFDYDTYEPLGGTQMFQKAADIANLGRSSGLKGWQQKQASYSRVQLIDEILNPKFASVRTASYRYHYAGVDSLALDPARAYTNILRAVETIGTARRQVDPRNILIRSFFDTKYLEIAETFATYHDPSVYLTFSAADPSHQVTYEEYRMKRR